MDVKAEKNMVGQVPSPGNLTVNLRFRKVEKGEHGKKVV